jgi:hypothetical protein
VDALALSRGVEDGRGCSRYILVNRRIM